MGIGNPGEEYRDTRHNIGWKVIDLLKDRCKSSFKRSTLAVWSKARLAGEDVILIKPLTFVNASGKAVNFFFSNYSAGIEDIIVIHDDLDLELGTVRIKKGGGDGGHNGLKSIISSLHSRDFLRIRVGIGKPSQKTSQKTSQNNSVVDHVLSSFDDEEKECAENASKRASEAVCSILAEGEVKAMNHYNKRKTEENIR